MKKLYLLIICLYFFTGVSNAQSSLNILRENDRALSIERSKKSAETFKSEYREKLKASRDLDCNLKSAGSISAVNVTDSLALVALYNTTHGASWNRNDNWLTGPVDTWYGITVDNGRVVSISLEENNLTDTLPHGLDQLSELQHFVVWGNSLTGEIHSEFGNLANLITLDLGINQFYGEIPVSLGQLSNLESLFIGSGSQLTGSIPAALGQLSELRTLALDGNQLSGTLPQELGNLSQLIHLFLHDNDFSGEIPSEIGQMTSLSNLYLGGNSFSGSIPSSLEQLSNLSQFYLSWNQLSGAIPSTLGQLQALSNLSLRGNQLSGSIPSTLGQLSNLSVLNLAYNQLSGSIPAELSNCSNLSQLEIENNNITGTLPLDLCLLPLQVVNFANNLFDAESCPTIQCLRDNDVDFSDADQLQQSGFSLLNDCNSYNLETDSLALVALYNATDGPNWTNSENWLTGPVSTWYGIVMGNDRVTEIWLGQNNLSDSLPASLGQLSSLEILDLGGNGLGGSILEEIGNLVNLRYLWLWGNQMTGTIPASLGQLSNLNILSLNGNNLTGNIPAELGWCNNLWAINLDWNFLDGEIPVELCNIENLSSANFASNNFDEGSCAAVTCLLSNGVSFNDSPDQLQRNGYSLTNDCGSIADSTWVTFRVNMQNEIINTNGIHINGSFSNWQEAVEMQLDSLSYYSASILVPAGQTITYKFVNGGTFEWEFYEFPPSNCTVGDYHDRELYVPHSGSELILDVVCFAGCQDCADDAIAQYSIQQIQGVGDVSPLEGQLVRTKGRVIGINAYGFFMQDNTGARNGIYVYDPDLAAQLYQGANIEIIATVSEYNGRTQLSGTLWFDYTNQTFDIYLSSIEVSDIGEDYEGVFVALDYVTIVDVNNFQEYIAVSETGDTTIIDNYLMQPDMEVGASYIVFGIVDFQYGSFRVNPRAESGIIRLYDLTFQVDMQNEEVDLSGIFVGGDWNDWMSWVEPEPMSVNGNIWSATIKLNAGALINYKFRNGEEWEIVLGDCATGENGDRFLTMPESDLTLDLVCFNKCISCDLLNATLPEVTINEMQTTDLLCYGASGGLIFLNYTVGDVGNITDRGILLGSVPNLLSGATKISEGSGSGNFDATIENLEAGAYYLCVYAENENGISYSDVEQVFIGQPDFLEMYVTENLHETSVYYDIFGIGGMPPYTYQLTICDDENNCIERAWQTDSYFIVEGLEQLTNYQADLEIMDANGCINTQTYSFTLAPDNSLQIDSIALVELYYATDGPNWTNNENWLSGPLDTWYGVTVQDGRVVSVDLNNNNLVGTLPARIGKLSALQSLVLWGNQLTGELPGELGTMSSLVNLDLGLNQFVGEIPPQLGELSNLQYLFIGSGSQLSGEIPASLGQLYNLRLLALDGNQLSGSIPYELGNLVSLTNLFLQSNQLSGSIPFSFGQLENLEILFLNHNNLSGNIPAELCNLPLGVVNFEQNIFNSYSCTAIHCLMDNGVIFEGDPNQTQQNGIELTQDCLLPSLRMVGLLAPEIVNSILCDPSENETVVLRFYNDGIEPVDGATLMYLLNGDTITVEIYSGIINPGDTIDYQFMVSADLLPDIYKERFVLKVFLLWEGGMYNGWTTTRTFDSFKAVNDLPDWTTYNTCNGLTRNNSFSISEDRNGNIWSSHFNGIEHFNGETWELYTTANGLAENYSWAIENDRNGNLWLAGTSEAIITRFNGTSFIKYPQPAIYDECIYEDTQGNMWFGSYNGNGVAKFDGLGWTYYSTQEANLGTAVLSIGEDSNGNLYFANSYGLTRFDGSNWSMFEIPGNSYLIEEIFFDSNGFTWFTTYDAIYRYDGSNWMVFSDPDSIVFSCVDIAEDLNGNLWFAGGNEVVKFDGSNWTKLTVEDGMMAAAGGSIYAIYADRKNDIWIGTYGGGISRLEQPHSNLGIMGLVSPVRNQNAYYLYCGLTDNEPVTVRLINNGDFPLENAVIGYNVDGITVSLDTLDVVIQPGQEIDYTFINRANFYHTDIIKNYQLGLFINENNGNPLDNSMSFTMRVDGDYEDAPGWTTYNSCDGMLSDVSWGIAEDGDGNIWSTDFYGASQFNGETWATYTSADGLGENYNWAILDDRDGNIWFSGSRGTIITKYDGNTFVQYPQPGTFEECIYQDSNGNMWFGSFTGYGAAMYDGLNWSYYSTEDIGCGNTIVSISEDKDGNVLLVSYDNPGVIFAFDGSAWSQMALPAPANNAVFSELFLDSKGNVWASATGLIGQYDGYTWLFFDQGDGIPLHCEDISEDIYGNIWFGGGRELVMFDGAVWTKYTVNEGLAAAQLGDIFAVYADSKGYVWAGTRYGGISKFEIEKNEICTTLHFQSGWNLFSTPVILDQDSVGFNFQSLVNNASLVKIQDELGNAFEDQGIFGGWDDSEMKLLRPYEGFKINVNRNDSIQFCGTPVIYPYPIYLFEGWNIMGYPQMISADAEDVVQQLIDRGSLLKVQDETGYSIEDLGVFGGWTNFIGNLISGEGYKIKVSANDTLWIYENYPKSTLVERPKVEAVHFTTEWVGNGVDHMNLNVVDLPPHIFNTGDELAVFDGALCVGAVTLLPENMERGVVSIAVSAADKYGMPGFGEGNSYSLRWWQQKTRIERSLEPDILKGPAVFTKHESAILSLKSFTGIVEGSLQVESVNCYPNPFNAELIIEARLASDKNVEIQILNQLGQVVKFLVNKQEATFGLNRWTWNGDNENGQKVEPGIYYVRLSAGDRIVVNKVVLTK